MSPPISSPNSNSWRPYTNARDFDTNVGMILIILVCALLSALALNAAIRFFLRSRSPARLREDIDHNHPHKATHAASTTLLFSPEMKLAGAEAECAICLSEFLDGEGVRVLTRCQHGFHVNCIETWLYSHSSCPTCRSTLSPDKNPCPRGEDADVESPLDLHTGSGRIGGTLNHIR